MATIGEITGLRPFKKWHDGKTEFKSRGAANAAIRALQARGAREYEAEFKGGDTLEPYPCNEGGRKHFHIGHSKKRDSKRRGDQKG